MFTPIADENITAFLPTMVDILSKSPDTWEDYYTLNDIVQGVLNLEYRLWIGFEGREPKLAALTSVVRYGARSVAYVDWVGGERVKEFLPHLTFIEDWALEQDCSRVEIKGRPAWLKLLGPLGYEQSHVVLGKNIVKQKGH